MRKHYEQNKMGASPPFRANHFQVFRVQDGWMALAKEEPFVAVNDPVNEQGELWFAFGEDPEDALARLKSELIRNGAGLVEPVA